MGEVRLRGHTVHRVLHAVPVRRYAVGAAADSEAQHNQAHLHGPSHGEWRQDPLPGHPVCLHQARAGGVGRDGRPQAADGGEVHDGQPLQDLPRAHHLYPATQTGGGVSRHHPEVLPEAPGAPADEAGVVPVQTDQPRDGGGHRERSRDGGPDSHHDAALRTCGGRRRNVLTTFLRECDQSNE